MSKENINKRIDKSILDKIKIRRKANKKKKKKQQQEQIKQKPVSFLAKYINRMEKIGKDGIYGLVRHANIQINIPKSKKNDDSDTDTDDDDDRNHVILPAIKINQSVKHIKTIQERYMERQQKRVLYRPYSLRDYRQLPDENSIKLGKLEPDLDTEHHRKKKQKRDEVIEFSKNLINKGIGLTMKKMAIPTVAHSWKVKSENSSSPLHLGKLYGKNMNAHNMIRDQERKRVLKILIGKSSNSQDSQIMQSGLSDNKQQYLIRLEKFKETLLQQSKRSKKVE